MMCHRVHTSFLGMWIITLQALPDTFKYQENICLEKLTIFGKICSEVQYKGRVGMSFQCKGVFEEPRKSTPEQRNH